MTAALALRSLWLFSALVAFVALIVWWRACRLLGRLREIHHVYWGFALGVAPWHLWLGWWALIPWALGGWIAWDDARLHELQTEWWRPGWRPLTGADDTDSWWHRLAARARVI